MQAPGGWRRDEIAYCSNVHPGEALNAVHATIADHIGAVRTRCGLDRLQTGLWLSARAAGRLAESPDELARFRAALDAARLDLVTLNGFPFGDFHAERVKQAVYRPDWADDRRLAYTLTLAELLAECQPFGASRGTISTLPLGFAGDWSAARHEAAVTALVTLCTVLAESHRERGTTVQVCLEMEPGCVLESTDDALAFFDRDLRPAARAAGLDDAIVQRHLGVCFDVCHQAVQFEDVYDSLQRLLDAGIAIGKVQLSSALTVSDPAAAVAALGAFGEPRYLHQTRMQQADGRIAGVDDLPEALGGELSDDRPWRVHFHLPLQRDTLDDPVLGTTRAAVERVFDWLAQASVTPPHLEVETYTWHVLPDALRPTDAASLHRGIAAELAWAAGALAARGLLLDG